MALSHEGMQRMISYNLWAPCWQRSHCLCSSACLFPTGPSVYFSWIVTVDMFVVAVYCREEAIERENNYFFQVLCLPTHLWSLISEDKLLGLSLIVLPTHERSRSNEENVSFSNISKLTGETFWSLSDRPAVIHCRPSVPNTSGTIKPVLYYKLMLSFYTPLVFKSNAQLDLL